MSLQIKLDTLNEELETLQSLLTDKESQFNSMTNDPLSHFEDEITNHYDCMLNEMYEEQINDIDFLCSATASELMKEYDPVCYRCGLSDYGSSFDLSQITEYLELEEEIGSLEDQISDLEEEIEELEN